MSTTKKKSNKTAAINAGGSQNQVNLAIVFAVLSVTFAVVAFYMQ